MGKPTTAEVLQLIGNRGVIVGSWPDDGTKDLDVVIRPRGPEEDRRNPVFQECLRAWRNYCESSIVGYLVVNADPITVGIFEDKGWTVDDSSKHENMLTFNQARRRSIEIEAFGIKMRAVRRA